MKKKINRVLLFLMSISMLFSSCEKNDGPDPDVKNGEIAIYTMLPNPGGQTGTAWLQLLDDLSPKIVSNQNAFQVGYGITPCFHKNDIFTFPSHGDASSSLVVTKWTRQNGQLVNGRTACFSSGLCLCRIRDQSHEGLPSDTHRKVVHFQSADNDKNRRD